MQNVPEMVEVMFRPPPTTTPKLQLDFLDLENFLVKVWGGGGGGVWCQLDSNLTF